MCKVVGEDHGRLEVEMMGIKVQIEENKKKEIETWVPWIDDEMQEVREVMEGGNTCCYSDASVSNDKKKWQ